MVVVSLFLMFSSNFLLLMAFIIGFLVLIHPNRMAWLRESIDTSLRSLLAQSHLAPMFWVDSFLSPIFIINWLPTKILDNVSHFFKLFC